MPIDISVEERNVFTVKLDNLHIHSAFVYAVCVFSLDKFMLHQL